MVNTVEQAKIAIAAAKFPPQGNRSIGGSIPAQNFQCPTGEYYRRANDEILVILQTESPEGVDNAEAIYSLPGVDAIFVGPNDLFWQMKKPDGTEPTPQEFEAMLQRVLAAGKKTARRSAFTAKASKKFSTAFPKAGSSWRCKANSR